MVNPAMFCDLRSCKEVKRKQLWDKRVPVLSWRSWRKPQKHQRENPSDGKGSQSETSRTRNKSPGRSNV